VSTDAEYMTNKWIRAVTPKGEGKGTLRKFGHYKSVGGGSVRRLQTAFTPAMDHTFINIKNRAMKKYTSDH